MTSMGDFGFRYEVLREVRLGIRFRILNISFQSQSTCYLICSEQFQASNARLQGP
ncbi:hypothetical protein JI435_409850 [Parastagonospora nodorum SN15]|uniref:Uncharacterized protein n=1 Tax=Phaeosphaeria nodorum (strain SN15 / ATCC MYA-4574 / FGSC 10173) TaxID=321614 RepID=A0A7U2I086_PHANO|nr:hypothetical protein JI435_409850 [Parastagonospora nodorum SN15]